MAFEGYRNLLAQRMATSDRALKTAQLKNQLARQKRLDELNELQVLGAIQPKPQKPIAVIGEDGKPTYVLPSDAVGMEPYKVPATSISINQPKLPKDYMPVDPENIGAGVVPIPGSPAEAEIREIEEKKEKKRLGEEAKAKVISKKVDEALDKVGFFSTGFFGGLLSGVGGTEARDLESTINTIKANLGFDRLQEMRDSSPTGGALGQVSERELTLLVSAVEALDQTQSRGQLIKNLQAVKNHYNKWKKTINMADERGLLPADGATVSPQAMSDEEIKKALGL